jgi:hypothetical protein
LWLSFAVVLFGLAFTVPVTGRSTVGNEAISPVDRYSRVEKSGSLTLNLETLRTKPFEVFDEVAQFFSPSLDSLFWYGPTGPNPLSWANMNVVCRSKLDFGVRVEDESGQKIGEFRFVGIEPEFYRLRFEKPITLPSGIYTLQVSYDGSVVGESRFAVRE